MNRIRAITGNLIERVEAGSSTATELILKSSVVLLKQELSAHHIDLHMQLSEDELIVQGGPFIPARGDEFAEEREKPGRFHPHEG